MELKTGIRTNLLQELELKKVGIRPKMRNETQGENGIVMWGGTEWGNGNRTKEIELMELGLTCSKFRERSCEIELISCSFKQELELIFTGVRTNLLRELELKLSGNLN